MDKNNKLSNESQLPETTQETENQKEISHKCTVSDLLPTELLVKSVQHRREDARFWIALLLIGTLCAVILFYLIVLSICPPIRESITDAFEKICFVLSPLTALMLGWYYKKS